MIQVETQARVVGKQRSQAGYSILGRHRQEEVLSGMVVVLLEAAEEERLVLADGTSQGETGDVAAVDRLRDSIELCQIRNRVEALRLIAPQQRSVYRVGAGLGNHVEHTAAGPAEL